MLIGYLVHDLNDASVERRCEMLERGGAKIVLAGFHRQANVKESVKKRRPIILGQSKDAAMVSRVLSTVRHVVSSPTLKEAFANCDVILVRNLEQLAIGQSIKAGRALIYECLDLHRLLVGSSMPSKILQSIEAKMLGSVDLLLTSSPAYLKHHFDSNLFEGDIYLIENKLLVDNKDMAIPTPPALSDVLRIGWFGMLRCRRSFEVLKNISRRSGGRIEVLIAGKPSEAELPDLPEQANSTPHMTYSGPYHYSDLPALYGQCHFAWAIDWFEAGMNSEWLLPNRLYESIAHGSVPIVKARTQMAKWLKDWDAGFILDEDQSPEESVLALSPSHIHDLQVDLRRVPPSAVMADAEDCKLLVSAMKEAV